MSANFHPGVTNCGGTMASTGCSCPRTTTGEVDIDLMAASVPMEDAAPDYSTWTPVEVDTELARLYGEHGMAMVRYSQYMDHAIGEVGRYLGRGYRGKASRQEVEDRIAGLRATVESGERIDYNERTVLDQYDKALERLEVARALSEQMEPLNEEFQSRGGWTRAFLVTNQGGHVHSSMDCSSCFKPGWDNSGNWRAGTRYDWRTEMSGATEAEVVDAAGERACTVCYPSAPVETLNKPTTMFTPDEIDKAKAREERAEKKKAADAKKIANAATADGSELVVDIGTRWPERFKTERAATTWAVDKIVDHAYGWKKGEPMEPERHVAVETILESLAEKHGKPVAEIRAEFDAKAKAKAKRDGYSV